MASAFHDINRLVHNSVVDSLRSIPRRDRPSSKAVWRLAQNISLVALNIRSACLVDFCRISAPQDTLPLLIDNLRKKCSACAVIFALLDPASGDVFFVNSAMLDLKLKGADRNDRGLELQTHLPNFPTNVLEDVLFIRLDKPPRVLESIPQPLLSLLAFLQSNLPAKANHHDVDEHVSKLPALLVLPGSNLGPGVLVPLAGILLDYPFAYVPPTPEKGNETFLSGEALDVFEIQLRSFETGESLELMKFSCPAEFSAATSTLNTVRERLGRTVDHLNSNRDGGQGPLWEIICGQSRVIVDRVAL